MTTQLRDYAAERASPRVHAPARVNVLSQQPFNLRLPSRSYELAIARDSLPVDMRVLRRSLTADPETLRDGRWSEASDDWGQDCASRDPAHLIDGSLSVNSFPCRADGGDGRLGPNSDMRPYRLRKDCLEPARLKLPHEPLDFAVTCS